MYHVDHPYSPPPHLTCLMCEESYTYRVLRNNSSVHSVSVTRSSSSSLATASLFFILPWERVSSPFLGCYYCPTSSLGFLDLCSNSPILWLPLTRSSLPSDCPESHLIWVVVSIRTVPLRLQQKSPWEPFLDSSHILHIVHYCIFSIPTQFNYFSFCSIKHSVQILGFNYPSILKQKLFDCCTIIVQLLFTITCNLESMNINTRTGLAYFSWANCFRRPLATIDIS